MPKKKQVAFQNNIPGKFIPRDDPPSATVFRSGTNDHRFNSKMAELLASSSSATPTTVNDENEPISNATKSTQDNPASPEMTSNDSSRVHSRLLHRRIVTMLETLRRRGGTPSPPTSPKVTPTHVEPKSQPITFGQLRQATTSTVPPPPPPTPPPPVVEEVLSSKVLSARSYTDLISMNNTQEKHSYHTNVSSSLKTDDRSDLTSMPINKSSSKHQANKERLYYSPSLEQLLEQHNVVPRTKEQVESKKEEQQKPPLTVDEILATYYSKVKVPTTTEVQPPSPPSYPNTNMGFYIHPPSPGWNSSQSNLKHVPPPRLMLNEQNRNRPPPPSYLSSVASGHQPPTATKHVIRPPVPSSVLEQFYSGPKITQHRSSGHSSAALPTSASSSITNSTMTTGLRPPPPHYEPPPTTHIERSHSALSSMNRPNYSQINPPQVGFDREFSRLLYGRDGGKRQKRKAFSDPVKKSVEEAGRSVEKAHRRLTTHVNKTDTVTEEEESGSDSNEIDKYEQSLLPQRRFQRPSDLRDSAKKAIVPANPVLKQRIPSFLRVYSQAASSSDILLQWHLFSLSELEPFDGMMTKLYKDENLVRVQSYEIYRAALASTLAFKTSSMNATLNNDDDDDDAITTTAL